VLAAGGGVQPVARGGRWDGESLDSHFKALVGFDGMAWARRRIQFYGGPRFHYRYVTYTSGNRDADLQKVRRGYSHRWGFGTIGGVRYHTRSGVRLSIGAGAGYFADVNEGTDGPSLFVESSIGWLF
jgi:hypothetical protein